MVKRTIWVGPENHFLVESGLMFVDELRADSASPEAPQSMRDDWAMIARWLAWTEGEFTAAQSEKIKSAWTHYFAIGLAPSIKLQEQFDFFARELKDWPKDERPPTEIMNVFDRMMASDEDIATKRKLDLETEAKRLRPLFVKVSKREPGGWWRALDSRTRKWLFACVVWAVLMTIYAVYFDPFDTGGWDLMDDEDTQRYLLILAAPIAGGLVWKVYEKWIK